MKNEFITTRNVKKFVALMSELQNLPPNIPKMALVYGEPGLGKSETVAKWAFKNPCVYVRAKQGMTTRWLLSEIANELELEAYWHIDDTFNEIKKALANKSFTIIIDEVDYLIEKKAIETLRDLHDTTKCPLVLVGMGLIDKKLSRYPHLYDRIYKKLKFEQFNSDDIREIVEKLTDFEFSEGGLEYLSRQTNQFRELVKLIHKIEKLAKTNEIDILDEYTLKGLLNNERTNIKALQKVG